MAKQATEVARRILNGEDVAHLPVEPGPPNIRRADWRQLRRWGLAENQLPAGTIVDYREPGLWQKYHRYFIFGIVVFVLQSFLIIALTLEAKRRKRLARQLKDLNRRLIDAQESERRRIARELHDDLNQRVVLLRSHIESLHSENEDHKASNGRLTELSEEAREISNGISQLSHQLHSSALDILGLQPALRGLARDLSLAYDLKIEFASVSVMIPMTPDVALCLFRVAQESLSNVIKHSGASWAEVSLSCEGHPKSIRLSVTDNGHGFDPSSLQADS